MRMHTRNKRRILGLAAALSAVLIGLTGLAGIPANADNTTPPYPCWVGSPEGSDCTAFSGSSAAAWADQYALVNGETAPWSAFQDDCTNFISISLSEGGETFVGPIPPGAPPDNNTNDDNQWWFNEVNGAYTYSWTVANDQFTYAEIEHPISTFPYFWVADPYFNFDNNNETSEIGGTAAEGAFISNGGMGGADPIDNSNNIVDPMSPGDVVFYDWQYSGDQYGNGFFANHAGIVVATSGTDPNSGWTGVLVDAHTTGHFHAIWNLIPYNSQYQATTDAWYDLKYNGDPYFGFAAGARNQQLLRGRDLPKRTSDEPVPVSRPPAIQTPTSPQEQLAYSGSLHVRGNVPSATVGAAETTFQAAMVARQQILVPPTTQPASVAPRPASGALSQMASTGQQEASGLFTGPALQQETGILHNAQTTDAKSDVRVLGGGADNFHYSTATSLPSREIELHGTFQAWARFAQVQAGSRVVPATPHNTLDYVATLVRSGNSWKVLTFNWAFAPGSEP